MKLNATRAPVLDDALRSRITVLETATGTAYLAAAVAAITAVVELHRPTFAYTARLPDGSVVDKYACAVCIEEATYFVDALEYPCPTVTAISESLGVSTE